MRSEGLVRRARIMTVNSEQCPPMASSGTSRAGWHARLAMECSRVGGKLRGQRHMAQREGTGWFVQVAAAQQGGGAHGMPERGNAAPKTR
jgi:hypothetical protein